MKMNGINGARIGGPSPVPPPAPDALAPGKSKSAPLGDRVELSDEARKLLQESASGSRQARIEAVRIKLETGQLNSPENRARAAEKLLRSGELDRPAE